MESDSAEPPLIRVLIPVQNHYAITLFALRRLVAGHNNSDLEVTVANVASSDVKYQSGRHLPWLRIWRTEANQGFLVTINCVAELALGQIPLLLDNDLLIGGHAFDSFARTIAVYPEVGVLGADLWSGDGRLLRLGGIV